MHRSILEPLRKQTEIRKLSAPGANGTTANQPTPDSHSTNELTNRILRLSLPLAFESVEQNREAEIQLLYLIPIIWMIAFLSRPPRRWGVLVDPGSPVDCGWLLTLSTNS